jgi:hypothetical protein
MHGGQCDKQRSVPCCRQAVDYSRADGVAARKVCRSMIGDRCLPRKYIAAFLKRHKSTRLHGFVFTSHEPDSRWGVTTYALKRTDNTPREELRSTDDLNVALGPCGQGERIVEQSFVGPKAPVLRDIEGRCPARATGGGDRSLYRGIASYARWEAGSQAGNVDFAWVPVLVCELEHHPECDRV